MRKLLAVIVLGSPGKVIKQVTDKEVEEIKENAKHYVEVLMQSRLSKGRSVARCPRI
jgi:carbonic anhydrase/acetyltransferase-like protein (isoleucine patch superfamily)|tara:strand:- start:93 stop:263 length:171 start_codon:yes stop_codon:yes gene_type:complete